jgi:transposase
VAAGDQDDDQRATDPAMRIASLEAALAERDAKLAELTELVSRQSAQLERLIELLGRNSKNSHLPPSSDGPGSGAGGGAASTRRPKSERKRGGQKGHRGSYRELLSVDRVDTFVDLFPEVCLGSAGVRLCSVPPSAAGAA